MYIYDPHVVWTYERDELELTYSNYVTTNSNDEKLYNSSVKDHNMYSSVT